MRFVRKGGVWKNTEDEILKAAVMKYGKNQWARVSSLLVRKSAKQCKARWHEWLDPSVKKTEWTRDEQEKLLHLAKIMPSQWRSIAAIVGRTASQCLEHYARLLDQAQAQEHAASGDTGPAPSSTMEDPRRLRPGEIDPHPETKPARPDPVDMDEDEKEMLSEARARLANTKGKKAKRKAREKQLEEARRLAVLQKRRELKAAGIEFRGPNRNLSKRKNKEMDYNVEIPFERRAPKGFFDTSEEDTVAKHLQQKGDEHFIGKSLTDIEGRRRDDIEEEERKRDAKRQKLLKKHDLPKYVARINQLNDPHVIKKRGPLVLPAPQVTDSDLRELASISHNGGTGGSVSTPALSDAMLRTPRVPIGADPLMQEAHNLIALTSGATPLVGGVNPELRETDFTPMRTPNALQTPTPRGAASTPGSTFTTSSAGTPRRDALGINTGSHSGFDAEESYEQRGLDQRRRKHALQRGLAAIPKPRHEYDLVLPEFERDNARDNDEQSLKRSQWVPDADDVADWEQQQRVKAKNIEFSRLPSALRRPELPRPRAINAGALVDTVVGREMLLMLRQDAASHPIKGGIGVERSLPVFTEQAMTAAKTLVENELHEHERLDSFDADKDTAAFQNALKEIIYLPSKRTFGRWSDSTRDEQCAALRQEAEIMRAELAKQAKKASKANAKFDKLTSGYSQRQRELAAKFVVSMRDLQQARIDVACFETLQSREQQAVQARIKRLEEELEEVKLVEEKLQTEFKNLSHANDSLTVLLET